MGIQVPLIVGKETTITYSTDLKLGNHFRGRKMMTRSFLKTIVYVISIGWRATTKLEKRNLYKLIKQSTYISSFFYMTSTYNPCLGLS